MTEREAERFQKQLSAEITRACEAAELCIPGLSASDRRVYVIGWLGARAGLRHADMQALGLFDRLEGVGALGIVDQAVGVVVGGRTQAGD
jgi:hypothetical protein